MALIEARQLTKEFQIFKRREGVFGAFQDLLHREYQTVQAVADIDLTIEAGEMVGYIGANGAGKSTTIKMLTGILVPSSGELRVDGFIPWQSRETYTRRIGVVFGQRSQLWWDLAVIETFRLLQKVYQVPEKEFAPRLERFTEMLEMKEFLHIPVRKLSLGQRMRCELTAALLHNPKLVFLDEPTIGLDVVAKDKIRTFLKEINQEFGTTILLTTHDLADIEALCPRVVMIDRGNKLYDGPLAYLQQNLIKERTLTLEMAEAASLEQIKAATAGFTVDWQQVDSHHLHGVFPRDQVTPAQLLEGILPRFQVKDISLKEVSIEEIVREIYQGRLNPQEEAEIHG